MLPSVARWLSLPFLRCCLLGKVHNNSHSVSYTQDDALDELPDEGTPAKFEDDLSDDEFNPLLFDEKDVDKMLQIAPELKEALWWPPPQPGHGYSPRPRLRKLDELGRAYGSGTPVSLCLFFVRSSCLVYAARCLFLQFTTFFFPPTSHPLNPPVLCVARIFAVFGHLRC